MSLDYFVYWKPKNVDHDLALGLPMDFARSNQFSKANSGDTFWIITVRNGDLKLLGKMKVEEVTDRDDAAKKLGYDNLLEGELYALAKEGTAQPIRESSIMNLVDHIKFDSKAHRNSINRTADGKIEAQQFQSMRKLTRDSVIILEEFLEDQIKSDSFPFKLPEEVVDQSRLLEGAVCRIYVNAYERNSKARRLCLDHHGTTCCVCGLDFGGVYGAVADGYMHVHHLRPVSGVGADYEVDPIADLIPVCPNCHAVIHLQKPPFSIKEVKALLDR